MNTLPESSKSIGICVFLVLVSMRRFWNCDGLRGKLQSFRNIAGNLCGLLRIFKNSEGFR